MELLHPISFAGGRIDRAAAWRLDAAWLAQARLAPATRIIAVRSSTQLLVADGPQLGRVEAANLGMDAELIFLGVDSDGAAHFAFDCGDGDGIEPEGGGSALGGRAFEELRALAAMLPAEEAALAAHAVAMTGWHQRHRFCGQCGGSTEVLEAGHCRGCTRCGVRHFPRTDPVVIMLVTDGERCVLGRRAGGRWWTVLAGFVEPGETLEQAVAREVQEEVGVRVTAARYLGSQPWPFPANLMLGFEARAEYGPIRLDGELEAARWFTRQELRDGLASGDLAIPTPVTIAHHLIQAWLADGSSSGSA